MHVFERAYAAFTGNALAPNQDTGEALKELHEAVLQRPTFQELKLEIIAATEGFIEGMHYAGSERIWMKEVGYTGKMVNLYWIVQHFFAPLRKLVQNCHFSQAKACLVVHGKWRVAHRAGPDAEMCMDTFRRFVAQLQDRLVEL